MNEILQITIPSKSKVSSTINKDIKNFGKQFMFDGKDDTCWNSDEGAVQWIYLTYDIPLTFSQIKIQFQGGFAAETGILQIINNDCIEFFEELSFKNINSLQSITLSRSLTAQTVKLLFNKCCDTFGRIIIYHFTLQ